MGQFQPAAVNPAAVEQYSRQDKVLTAQFRNIPSVERVMAADAVAALTAIHNREWVVALVRQELAAARQRVRQGQVAPSAAAIAAAVGRAAAELTRPAPRPVINATGVILHTNLGRSPLSPAATAAAAQAAQGYSNLELDLENGRRGSRQAHLQTLLQELTGADAGLVVNNNAAAVLLGLSALAAGKAVIVSRGEAVEIGGGFRIPDVLAQSGAQLVDVGTTNRTYARDYASAITANTAALLKAHASNFRVEGFTAAVEPAELAALGAEHNIPVLHDIGSGCLLPTERYGLAHEPTPQESVAAGVGLTFFSGDKLLGGPQAGIVVGTKELIGRLERHPLARAVRIDKQSLAALIATLTHYRRREAEREIPIWRMLGMPLTVIEERARAWRDALNLPESLPARIEAARSAIGGGSLPGETLPTKVLSLPGAAWPGGAAGVMERLRRGNPPVIARIEDDRVLLDPRTVLPEEETALLKCLQAALSLG